MSLSSDISSLKFLLVSHKICPTNKASSKSTSNLSRCSTISNISLRHNNNRRCIFLSRKLLSAPVVSNRFSFDWPLGSHRAQNHRKVSSDLLNSRFLSSSNPFPPDPKTELSSVGVLLTVPLTWSSLPQHSRAISSHFLLLSPSIFWRLFKMIQQPEERWSRIPLFFNPENSAFSGVRQLFHSWKSQTVQRGLVKVLTVMVLTSALYSDIQAPDAYDTFENVPQDLSGGEKRKKIQRPKSRKAEGCTQKCVGTCIRGGAGSPGEGPFNVRKPLVVFKEGFRSRQYCLIECSDICNLIGDGDDGP